jgi:hypothetical protein
MRFITWKRLGIIASVIWVAVGPTYFHLNREDNDKRIARDQYERCIKQARTTKEGVERCNKDLRQALAIAHWSSWAQLAFIPVVLAWFVGWGLLFLVRRVRSRPETRIGYLQRSHAEDHDEQSTKGHFPAPWTVEAIPQGFRVVDANGQSLAYVYSRENPNDAQLAKVLTDGEARRIASNIAKLPAFLSASPQNND